MAQAGGEQTEADDPVGNHHIVQNRKLLAQQLVALALNHEEFQSALECIFELRRVPRLGDVLVNRAGIDRGDGRLHIRVSGGQNADDLGPQLARPFEQPNALFARHSLVGH